MFNRFTKEFGVQVKNISFTCMEIFGESISILRGVGLVLINMGTTPLAH